MLSGETAVGGWPAIAVRTMSHIAETVERYVGDRERSQPISRLLDTREVDAALAQGVWRMAYDLDVKLIAVWSHGGNIARICSKLRPPVPIVALTESPRAVRRMALYFAVHPLRMDVPQSVTDFAPKLDERLLATGLAHDGDEVLIIGGTVIGSTGRSNAIVVHTVGQPA